MFFFIVFCSKPSGDESEKARKPEEVHSELVALENEDAKATMTWTRMDQILGADISCR